MQTSRTRGFTTTDLANLSREVRRQLCQLLIVESGLRIVGVDRRADFDQMIVKSAPLWRIRRACIRVVYRSISARDVRELDALARDKGFADALLFEAAAGQGSAVASSDRVHMVSAEDLVERLEGAALVAWADGRPHPNLDSYELVRRFDTLLPSLDAVGLRWLVPLSLNKLPLELAHMGLSPDRLFERVVFRVLTSTFRFGGTRIGASAPGTAAPDAIFTAPCDSGSRFSALSDSKAARDGFVMDIADERALRDYVRDYRARAEAAGDTLRYVMVVSSSFPSKRAPHPFDLRAARLHSDTGVKLAYVRTSDLLVLAVALERDEASPALREAIKWDVVLDQGVVTRQALLDAYDAAKRT